jgi:hypothetical protein
MTRLAAALLALGAAALVWPVPAAHADSDTCRIAPDGLWYSNIGQRCRGVDIDAWHIGGAPQLFCWFYPLNHDVCGPTTATHHHKSNAHTTAAATYCSDSTP